MDIYEIGTKTCINIDELKDLVNDARDAFEAYQAQSGDVGDLIRSKEEAARYTIRLKYNEFMNNLNSFESTIRGVLQ